MTEAVLVRRQGRLAAGRKQRNYAAWALVISMSDPQSHRTLREMDRAHFVPERLTLKMPKNANPALRRTLLVPQPATGRKKG